MMSEPVHGEDASRVLRLLVRLVGAACRFPRLVLAVALLGCIVSIFASCTYLQYHTERGDLINPDKSYQQRWRRYLAEFGEEDDIVLVVKGTQRERMRQSVECLAARIQKQPEFFDRLFYKVDL